MKLFFAFGMLLVLIAISGCATTTVSGPEEDSNESVPVEVVPSCPTSCEDNNSCTLDLCSETTNFSCSHASIVPCCGNAVCEDNETCYDCNEDCGKCTSLQEVMDIVNTVSSISLILFFCHFNH